MEPDALTLARLLSLALLIAATIEYAEIAKRRAAVRRYAAERSFFEADGLRGLVRVFLADAESRARTRDTRRSQDPGSSQGRRRA
jgi:hypothetical protein